MFDASQCTSIGMDVLTRLIAAARVSETVAWATAEAEAQHEVAELWANRSRSERLLPVEVSNDVLFQLAAAACSAIKTDHASGSAWALQVEHDLGEISRRSGVGRAYGVAEG